MGIAALNPSYLLSKVGTRLDTRNRTSIIGGWLAHPKASVTTSLFLESTESPQDHFGVRIHPQCARCIYKG